LASQPDEKHADAVWRQHAALRSGQFEVANPIVRGESPERTKPIVVRSGRRSRAAMMSASKTPRVPWWRVVSVSP
jgi:hypothetical protein